MKKVMKIPKSPSNAGEEDFFSYSIEFFSAEVSRISFNLHSQLDLLLHTEAASALG